MSPLIACLRLTMLLVQVASMYTLDQCLVRFWLYYVLDVKRRRCVN